MNMKKTRFIFVLLGVMSFGLIPAAAQNTSITGILRNASGEPVQGALIKIKSKELGLGFMVVSQAQGRYTSPNLAAGAYQVQAFGNNYQSELSQPTAVNNGEHKS